MVLYLLLLAFVGYGHMFGYLHTMCFCFLIFSDYENISFKKANANHYLSVWGQHEAALLEKRNVKHNESAKTLCQGLLAERCGECL